jgi:hypothetical protein
VITEAIECVLVLRQAVLLAPVGVEVVSVPGAFGDGDSKPIDYPEDVFEVGFAEAGTVEVINAEQDVAFISRQEGVENEVGRIALVEVAGGGGRQAGSDWRLAIGDTGLAI